MGRTYILMAIAAALLAASSTLFASATHAQTTAVTTCALEPGPARAVTGVIDGETISLDDGTEVRLVGALAPRPPDAALDLSFWPPEREAKAALERLVLGRSVTLAYAGRKSDRYGRMLAHVFVDPQSSGETPADPENRVWVQAHMLSHGHSRAFALKDSHGCCASSLHTKRSPEKLNSAFGHMPPINCATLSLDLRTEAGLAKSLLLHRLLLIKVPWGTLQGSGSSRGTFRENWKLRWDPEFSVRLAEALVHGTTVEQASGNAAIAAAKAATSLGAVSDAVKGCLLAGLDQAARTTISLLQAQAIATSDIGSLAQAVPPLVTILRYGTARDMPAAELRLLVVSLAESVSAGLVYGCRNLQTDEAGRLRRIFSELDRALPLIESEPVTQEWRRALAAVADDETSHPLLCGLSVRALYEASVLAVEEAGTHLSRALSKSVPPLDAGHWLDGFLGQSSNVLIHDHALLGSIDQWLAGLGEEDFTHQLPTLVRSFASIDKIERRRVLDMLKIPASASLVASVLIGNDASESPGFAAALPLLLTILGLDQQEHAT